MNFNDIPAKRVALMAVAGTNPYPGNQPYLEIVQNTFTDELAQSKRLGRLVMEQGWGIDEDGYFDRDGVDAQLVKMGFERTSEWIPEWTGWHCMITHA